jgi:hypothetical protein
MSTQDVSEQLQRRLGLGWHWLWFLPLCVIVLSVVERHAVAYAFAILKVGWERWTWGSLFSPSADFCVRVIIASVVWPVLGLGGVALLVAGRQQWRYLLLLIIGIFLIPFITDALIWIIPLHIRRRGRCTIEDDSLHPMAERALRGIVTAL